MDADKKLTPLPPARERTFLYTIARGLSAVVLRVLFPVRYYNLSAFAALRPPCILISNHKSLLDPFVLAFPCKQYEIRFLGKKELCKGAIAGWIMDRLHVISVDRHHTDLQAMRKCTKALREGRVLGIFPEGTRHLPDLMSTVETGTAVLALRAGAPLLPVYIAGKLRLFRKTNVYIGKPLDISDLSAQGTDARVVAQLTDRIRDTFLAMRAEDQKRLPG